jgi:hypothetical protein
MICLPLLQSGMMPSLRKKVSMETETRVNPVEYDIHIDQRVAASNEMD